MVSAQTIAADFCTYRIWFQCSYFRANARNIPANLLSKSILPSLCNFDFRSSAEGPCSLTVMQASLYGNHLLIAPRWACFPVWGPSGLLVGPAYGIINFQVQFGGRRSGWDPVGVVTWFQAQKQIDAHPGVRVHFVRTPHPQRTPLAESI